MVIAAIRGGPRFISGAWHLARKLTRAREQPACRWALRESRGR